MRKSLEHFRKQAKDLRKAFAAGAPEAQRVVQRVLDPVRREPIVALRLHDAQWIVAREAGFESWAKLKRALDPDQDPAWRAALAALRGGQPVLLYDDQGGEDEADLVLAAEKATPQTINFITKHGRGTLCLALTPERVERLGLPLMTPQRRHPSEPAFTVSIDAAEGVTTGVSAADRARTVLAAVADDATPAAVRSPGHIFPLRAEPRGLRDRRGHTEGAVDLTRLAGLKPAAVICEVLNDDGTMARWDDLEGLATAHALPVLKISDVARRVGGRSGGSSKGGDRDA